jgi:hypothetical protein
MALEYLSDMDISDEYESEELDLSGNLCEFFNISLRERLKAINKHMKTNPDICKKYICEMRIRWRMKSLLNFWLQKKIDKRSEPAIDLITLQPVKQPIYVYNITNRRRFVFEARTLCQSINSNLKRQNASFSQPIEPKNTFTNKPFTYIQMISIYYQLMLSGYMCWSLGLYMESCCRIDRYKLVASIPLTIHAIQDEINNVDSEESKEMQINFIESISIVNEFDLTNRKRKVFEVAIERIPNHPIIASLRALAYMELEADVLNQDVSLFLSLASCSYLEKWYELKNHPNVRPYLT